MYMYIKQYNIRVETEVFVPSHLRVVLVQVAAGHGAPKKPKAHSPMDSLRGSSVKIGTIQRRLAWPLRKDDTHKSRSEKHTHPWVSCKSRATRAMARVFCSALLTES